MKVKGKKKLPTTNRSIVSSLLSAVPSDDAGDIVRHNEAEGQEEQTGDGLPGEGLEEGVKRLADSLGREARVGGHDVGVSGHALLPGGAGGSGGRDAGGRVAAILAVIAGTTGNLLQNFLGKKMNFAVDVRVDGSHKGVEQVKPKDGDEDGEGQIHVARQEIR